MAVGRPREFDVDKALERALRVFWRKGYEGASLPELTKAMGINRPSMYAAFGNKEALFKKALDRYSAGQACYIQQALAEPTAKGAAERLLLGTAAMLGDSKNPRGCLMVQAALSCSEAADSVRRELAKRRQAGETEIRGRFERAKAEGDLPQDSDPADLARFITTTIYGMAVQAAGGASLGELHRVAETALRAWPT